MKSSALIQTLFLMLLVPLSAIAQDSTPRDVTLKITDRRGQPIPDIVVRLQALPVVAITDSLGIHIFKDLTDTDSLVLALPEFGQAILPVAGLDSVVVALRSATSYTRTGFLHKKYIGRSTVNAQRARQQDVVDVEALVRDGARSLSELVQGKFSSRGPSSIGGGGSSGPLVVVNGTQMGALSSVNNTLSVYDIKTVEVLRDGSAYGSQGINGVILVTTN